MVALALELQRRGHTPVVATSEYYREKIAGTGVAFHAARPNLTPDDKGLLRAVMDEHGGPEYVIRRLMVPAVREMYADLMEAARGADLLLTAELVLAADSVAEKADIPWIVATLAPLSFMSRYDPPILIQAPWLGRIGGVRANASTLSHAELDEALELDRGDPADLAARYLGLRTALPSLHVVGGCCGTDHHHVEAIATALCGAWS